MSEANLYEALKALVEATEAADNPGDYGVGSDAPPMLKAREALREYEVKERIDRAISEGIYGDFSGRMYEP